MRRRFGCLGLNNRSLRKLNINKAKIRFTSLVVVRINAGITANYNTIAREGDTYVDKTMRILSLGAHMNKNYEQRIQSHMNIKHFIFGIIFFLFLISGVVGEETATTIQANQTIQPNETQTAKDTGIEEPTLEELMQNRDWNKIAEMMNTEIVQGAAVNSIESSIKPVGSNERWDNWFAPKEEEGGFIIIPCGS